MMKVTFFKVLMLIRQVYKKNVLFPTIDKGYKFKPDVCNESHYVLISMNLGNIAILNNYSADYCFMINKVSKSEATGLFKKMKIQMRKGNYYKT